MFSIPENFKLAKAYRIGDLPKDIWHPLYRGNLIYQLTNTNNVILRSFLDSNSYLDTKIVGKNDILEAKYILTRDLVIALYWRGSISFQIPVKEVPLYIKLGILIPLSDEEFLAHQYSLI